MQSRDDRKPTLKGHRTLNAHPTNYRDLLREATLQSSFLRSELEDDAPAAERAHRHHPAWPAAFPGGADSPEGLLGNCCRNGVDAITDIPQPTVERRRPLCPRCRRPR